MQAAQRTGRCKRWNIIGRPTWRSRRLRRPHPTSRCSGRGAKSGAAEHPTRRSTHACAASTCMPVTWVAMGSMPRTARTGCVPTATALPRRSISSRIASYGENVVVAVGCSFTWSWLADLCRRWGVAFVLGPALYMKAIPVCGHAGTAPRLTLFGTLVARATRRNRKRLIVSGSAHGARIEGCPQDLSAGRSPGFGCRNDPHHRPRPSGMRDARDLLRRRCHAMPKPKPAELLVFVRLPADRPKTAPPSTTSNRSTRRTPTKPTAPVVRT